jgi:hypothetical protein
LGAAVHGATVLAEQALCASPGSFITKQLANRFVKRSQVACLPLTLGLGCLCCQFCVAVLDKPPVYKVAAGAVYALGFGCCGFSTSQLVLAFADVLVWGPGRCFLLQLLPPPLFLLPSTAQCCLFVLGCCVKGGLCTLMSPQGLCLLFGYGSPRHCLCGMLG